MLFSAVEGVPGRFAGISKDEWSAVLEDAARVGLLTGLGAGMYQIHPALPGYLAAGWHAEDPAGYDQERQACRAGAVRRLRRLQRLADRADRIRGRRPGLHAARVQRRTLGAMLGHALDHHAWDDADGIVRALDAYWDTRGLGAEAAAWADRILDATAGPGQAPASRPLAVAVHHHQQATRQKDAGQPDQAAQAYRRALAYLQDQPATDWTRGNIAVIYHQLGMTAQDRGRLDEAEDWYRKSLAIKEELGDRPGMAITYEQLGMTAQDRGRLDEAEDWYRKSLAISEELGDRPGMASTYHQLGMTAQAPGAAGGGRGLVPRSPWPSTRNSATAPAWRSPTTSSATPPRLAGGWRRPRTGTARPSPSTKNSATARHGDHLPPARHHRPGPRAAG